MYNNYVDPLKPTGLNIAEELFNIDNITLIFTWDTLISRCPEALVDRYNITIIPEPLSHPANNIVLYPPFNVTLDYNVVYNMTVMALNIAGDSQPTELLDIEYSKFLIHIL